MLLRARLRTACTYRCPGSDRLNSAGTKTFHPLPRQQPRLLASNGRCLLHWNLFSSSSVFVSFFASCFRFLFVSFSPMFSFSGRYFRHFVCLFFFFLVYLCFRLFFSSLVPSLLASLVPSVFVSCFRLFFPAAFSRLFLCFFFFFFLVFVCLVFRVMFRLFSTFFFRAYWYSRLFSPPLFPSLFLVYKWFRLFFSSPFPSIFRLFSFPRYFSVSFFCLCFPSFFPLTFFYLPRIAFLRNGFTLTRRFFHDGLTSLTPILTVSSQETGFQ